MHRLGRGSHSRPASRQTASATAPAAHTSDAPFGDADDGDPFAQDKQAGDRPEQPEQTASDKVAPSASTAMTTAEATRSQSSDDAFGALTETVEDAPGEPEPAQHPNDRLRVRSRPGSGP